MRELVLPPRVSEAVGRSAAPQEAHLAVSTLSEQHPGLLERLGESQLLTLSLVEVTTASRSLTRLLVADPAAIEVLANPERRPALELTDLDALARWKRLELLRIAARDLGGLDGLESVGAALALLADDVLSGACKLCGIEDELAVIGMGKLGAQELNYASDVDIIFVGEAERESSARQVMSAARRCYRVDADLRPEGRSGRLVRSLDSYKSYWERWAMAWEMQALLKARPVAGAAPLGKAFDRAVSERIWGRPFGADEIHQVRDMKARSEGEIVRRGLTTTEVKRGYGGIRDVEFSVQILQMVHGRHDPALRTRSTLSALGELSAAGYVDTADAYELEGSYRFLRTVEHRLQLVEEAQVHTVPSAPEARSRLARVLGFRDRPEGSALERFDETLARHQARVRAIHERLFFRPLLESFAYRSAAPHEGPPRGVGGGRHRPLMGPESVRERLEAFGFRDVERTRAALAELTRGLTRKSRLMEQMLPVLLDWLSETPDPDLGLLGLRNLAAFQRQHLVSAFRESPETARRVVTLLGTSRLLADPIRQNPELLADLGDDAKLAPRTSQELASQAHSILGLRHGRSQRQKSLVRMKQDALVRIAARDVLDMDDVTTTGTSLSQLAEAMTGAALERIEAKVPIAVIAMGRFGGAELSYASDLDVLLVSGGTTARELARGEEAGAALFRELNGDTPAERIFTIDAGLRPEGRAGRLVRDLFGYRSYYGRWGQTWERQALVRAAPVAGEATLGAEFMKIVEDFVWTRPFNPEDQREVRRMKARIEQERMPANEDPQFHLKLGRGSLSDIEWTAQLLQLIHGIRSTGTIAAIEALMSKGFMDESDGASLVESYKFCERTRNRWFLVGSAPGDSLPSRAAPLGRLARSLGMTPAELRSEYRRVTRRARQVMERLFYGMSD